MASAAGRTGGSKRPRVKKPITAHPLFSSYVAVWFAALFGLSSLAVGVPNLERIVTRFDLQVLLPAAAPPLGDTARVLIAVAMAVLGAVVGIIVARQFAPARERPASAIKPPREPLAWPRIRWPERPAKEVAEPPVAVHARDTHPDAPVRRPIFAHEEFGESGEAEDADAVLDMEALRAARGDDVEVDLVLPSFLSASRPTPPKVEAPDVLEPEAEAPQVEAIEAEAIEAEPEPDFLKPAESEFAVTLEGHYVEAAPAEEVEAEEPKAEPVAFDLPPGEAADRIASAELADLSPVELLERFAIALQRRQERAGAPLSAEQAARITAIGEAALKLGRDALRELDHVEADAAAAPRKTAKKGLAVVPPAPSAGEAADPDETEKALREALAALQRMTGTA